MVFLWHAAEFFIIKYNFLTSLATKTNKNKQCYLVWSGDMIPEKFEILSGGVFKKKKRNVGITKCNFLVSVEIKLTLLSSVVWVCAPKQWFT